MTDYTIQIVSMNEKIKYYYFFKQNMEFLKNTNKMEIQYLCSRLAIAFKAN